MVRGRKIEKRVVNHGLKIADEFKKRDQDLEGQEQWNKVT